MKNTALPLVINFHATAACNFQCRGCYSKWHNHQNEAWNDPTNVRKIIENIARFHRDHFGESAAPWRLSIVGGEPVLFKDKVQFVAKTAHAYGAEVSVISNGSHLENIFPIVRQIPFGCCKGVTDEQFFSSGGAPSQHIFVEDNAAMTESYSAATDATIAKMKFASAA